METNKIICGDTLEVLRQMPDESVDCIVTSPPYYGLRDYGVTGQIGLEKTLEEYLGKMFEITNELQRVLKSTGTLWWNHGDCYGGAISAPNAPKLGARAKDRIYSRPAIGLEKSLLLQNFRLVQRMIDDDGDDIYELKSDTPDWVKKELAKLNLV